MSSEIDHPQRRSIRLKGYDYSSPGAYFVTVCEKKRRCMFGDVVDGEMRLSEYGRVVQECWEWLERRYQYVNLDQWVVMPNHIHGIIVILNNREVTSRGGSRTAPTKRKPLGRLIGAFKTISTKHINQLRGTPGVSLWQRNYYEHIIRDKSELDRIRHYIVDNPLKWEWDKYHPIRG